MDNFGTQVLPKLVKGVGFGLLTLLGIGGGIAYVNYRS